MELLNHILDLLYPAKCAVCQRILDDGEKHICAKCRNSLPRTVGAQAVRSVEFTEKVCFPFKYQGDFAEAIKRFKFSGCKGYSDFFSYEMERRIGEDFPGDFDYITWVPISRKRYRHRGYDQAELLAEKIADKMNYPIERLLIKTKNTTPQSQITNDEMRKANVMGVYSLAGIDVEGKRILIIDDVVTTGSTISECAKTLLLGGADAVYGACIATAR